MSKEKHINFLTAIITWPSDYDGQLNTEYILDYLDDNHKINTAKCVIAREDPDEEIQRIHFHMYIDYKNNKHIRSTNYYDVPLRAPVVCFIRKDEEHTRFYQLYSELESKLGIDNLQEMAPKLDQYTKEDEEMKKENVEDWEYLAVAHPNIQLKKEYGDKYFMLKYVMKQKIITRRNFNIDTETAYYLDNGEKHEKIIEDLKTKNMFQEFNVNSLEEITELCIKYCNKTKRFRKGKSKDKGKDNQIEYEFCCELRELMLENKGITKKEVMQFISSHPKYNYIYWKKYLNYNKLINDSFKNKPNAKPKRNYDFKFWLPIDLYNYVKWLDNWVMNWSTGQKDKCEHRPKGLCLIGNSRTGKTTLMTLLGDFSYFKNVWNSDNWELLPPYTIMDDMDAQDEGKGLSFSWFKPWFGAQDAMTITDKYKPKEDIVNGKPLIWLNNYDIEETFQSKTAQKYIWDNMVYVNIGNKKLYEKPEPFEWVEGHSDYIEWDPKTTWYYQNVIKPMEQQQQQQIEEREELEPLTNRKRRLEQQQRERESKIQKTISEAGRLNE